MMTGIVQDKNLEKQIEKQMGCMTGFLQIFDRHQMLTGKRLYSTKRLPPSSAVDSARESEKNIASPTKCVELEKLTQNRLAPFHDGRPKSLPAKELRSPLLEPVTPADDETIKPLPIFQFKEGTRSSWKFSREAPRLSLDSRAIFDAKGSIYPREIHTNTSILPGNRCETSKEGDKQRRSPSVIARLMGLELSPNPNPEPVNKFELQRSASESRVSKDFYQCRFVDGNGFHLNQSRQANSQRNIVINNAANKLRTSNARLPDRKDFASRNVKIESVKASHRGIGQRKGFFDSAEVFPEPTKQNVTVCGEIEKRLKLRGIDEPTKDLETLRQILEALQLKGLLHSSRSSKQIVNRNYGYDQRFSQSESPIVVMKPARSPDWMNCSEKIGNKSPSPSLKLRSGARRNVNVAAENFPAMSPWREQSEIDWNVRNQNRGRNSSSPTRSESSVMSPSRRGQSSIETHRRCSGPGEHRRVTPVQSPKISSRRTVSNPQTTNRTVRNRKASTEIDLKEDDELSSTVSETSISASSQNDTERCRKVEEYKEGRSLLERCDKLLNSIAEITATELQPSPVSVLDSPYYKEESSPPPVLKRQIDFNDRSVEIEDDDIWNTQARFPQDKSNDDDFLYVSDILQALNYLHGDMDAFLLLERQQCLKGRDTSKISNLRRKLIFDTVNEILDRNREFPPQKSILWPKYASGEVSFQQIWTEFQRIRERDGSEDLLEVIGAVLRKDLAGDAITGWGDWPVEMSEMVLDIERLIFKDLITEHIRDLAAFSGKCNSNNHPYFSRRKLMF